MRTRLLTLFTGIGLICAMALLAPRALATVSAGQRAPAFTLPRLSGGQGSLSQYRGKVVLIDFWAQWCEPCKKELPALDQLSKTYASKGVAVLLINIDKERENAERLVKQLGVNASNVLLDQSGSVAGAYDLPKMPSSFVVDKKGIVRYVNEGFDGAADVDRFRAELDALAR